MSSEPYIGSIKTFAFNYAPRGYMFCNGQLLAISQNSALFALIGTFYGGNGTTNFALPNLQSRMPIGMGQGPGLSPYQIGQVGGQESVTLTQLQMPQHNHTFTNNGSTLNAVQTKGTESAPDAGFQLARLNEQNSAPLLYIPSGNTNPQVPLGGLNVAGNISVAGGSQPHTNIQPYLGLNFSIAVQGIFPSRN